MQVTDYMNLHLHNFVVLVSSKTDVSYPDLSGVNMYFSMQPSSTLQSPKTQIVLIVSAKQLNLSTQSIHHPHPKSIDSCLVTITQISKLVEFKIKYGSVFYSKKIADNFLLMNGKGDTDTAMNKQCRLAHWTKEM